MREESLPTIAKFRKALKERGFKETSHPLHGVYSFERNYTLTTGQYCEVYEHEDYAFARVFGEGMPNITYPGGQQINLISELKKLVLP